jgi:oligo-1,6-glucosidase
MKKCWWKEGVIYQIYPKSFFDSSQNGVGDLLGITQKLDYLKNLGIDILWLSPIYKSPNDDNGYDISDYFEIMPELGNMKDFDVLLYEAHKRGLKIVLDIALNHTSDEHPWFIESSSSKKNPKRDFYIWKEPKENREPNNWGSFFSPSAWEYQTQTGEYYLHIFSKKQPDLNWNNPIVRMEVYGVLKWWLDKGVDGFRLDVINAIAKKDEYPDAVPSKKQKGPYVLREENYYNQPKVHAFLKEMHREVFEKYNMVSIGETPCISPEDAHAYSNEKEKSLDMVLGFELRDINYGENGKWDRLPWDFNKLRSIICKWQTALYEKGWQGLFLGNHDTPRLVSFFGDDKNYWFESATMLATMLFTLQGTPFVFQGDEIGMTNVKFSSIHHYKDIDSIFFYERATKENGWSEKEALEAIWEVGRDNARTPFQWSSMKNSGFSKGNPWIQTNPNYPKVNVENQINDPNSILNYYKKIIRFRKENPVLVYGKFMPIDENHEKIFSYLRVLEDRTLLILLHYSQEVTPFTFPKNFPFSKSKLLLTNTEQDHDPTRLNPYEARIYEVFDY